MWYRGHDVGDVCLCDPRIFEASVLQTSIVMEQLRAPVHWVFVDDDESKLVFKAVDDTPQQSLQSFDDVYHTTKFLEDVSMLMSVEIGRCEMTVRDVLALKVGSLVEFSKVVGEPMDVIIADHLMARGEVVVVNERYGVRISEVTRPDEKIGDRRE